MIIYDINKEQCLEFVEKTGIGRLACARNNQPYVVPVYLVHKNGHLYSFTSLGHKIEWMRMNPLVCIELDQIEAPTEWTSVVVFGQYQELSDEAEFKAEKDLAYDLLKHRVNWWETAYVSALDHEQLKQSPPIFYRVKISSISGRRAEPTGS
jgi:uncharacterized protein